MDGQSRGFLHFHFFLRVLSWLDCYQFTHRTFSSRGFEHLYHSVSGVAAGTIEQVRFYGGNAE